MTWLDMFVNLYFSIASDFSLFFGSHSKSSHAHTLEPLLQGNIKAFHALNSLKTHLSIMCMLCIHAHTHTLFFLKCAIPWGLLRWQKGVTRGTKLNVRAHRDSQTGRRSHSVEAWCSASCVESQSGQMEKQCSSVNSSLRLTPSTLETSDREALKVPSNLSLRLTVIFHSGHFHNSTFGTLVCLSRMTHFKTRSHLWRAFGKKIGWDRKDKLDYAPTYNSRDSILQLNSVVWTVFVNTYIYELSWPWLKSQLFNLKILFIISTHLFLNTGSRGQPIAAVIAWSKGAYWMSCNFAQCHN